MPPVLIPVIAAGLTAVGTSVAVAAFVAPIVAYTVFTAAAVGASYLASSMMQKKASDAARKQNNGQVSVRQSLPTRQRGYGRAKLGGAVFFLDVASGALATGTVHCEGLIDGFEEWWLNDKNCTIAANSSGGANGALPWGSNVFIESHRGFSDDVASASILSYFGRWTSAHRCRGLAYSVVICKPVSEKVIGKVYPNGAPAIRVVCRLAQVYDPRKSTHDWGNSNTWEWSDNSALCILDYLVHPRGMNLPKSRIDLQSFRDMADLCDSTVPLKAGGTVRRYWLGGTYDLTEEPKEVLRRMLATCDGEIVPRPNGTIGIVGGQWVEPEVTITDAIVKGYEYQNSNAKMAVFNRLKVSFTSPVHDWQVIETEAWDDTAAQTASGEVFTQDITLPMVLGQSQARRLAKIAMARANPRHRFTNLTTNLAGLAALGERVIRLELADLGISGSFVVTRFAISADFTECTMDLASLDSTAYDWNAATEEGTAPPLPGYNSAETVQVPDGFTATQKLTTVTGGIVQAQIRATCGTPSRADLTFKAQYAPAGSSAWVDMDADGDYAAISPVVADGASYDVRGYFATVGGGSVSAYTATSTLVVVVDATPPTQPTGASVAAAGATAITVAWTSSSAANQYGTQVFRQVGVGTPLLVTTVFTSSAVATSWTDSGLPTGFTYSYTLKAVNRSLQPSPATVAGSVTL